MTCTPYWAGHWPVWNMHMTSIESGVTVFCNSVLGARSNRDGFSIYAAVTGRYPRFGYHFDENRVGTQLVHVDAVLENVTDFTCLGYHVGALVGPSVPDFVGFGSRPTLDELDGLRAGLATTGSFSMFIAPGITPPYGDVDQASAGRPAPADSPLAKRISMPSTGVRRHTDRSRRRLRAPRFAHASLVEMHEYGRLLSDARVHPDVELWIITSRAVKSLASQDIVWIFDSATCMFTPQPNSSARSRHPFRKVSVQCNGMVGPSARRMSSRLCFHDSSACSANARLACDDISWICSTRTRASAGNASMSLGIACQNERSAMSGAITAHMPTSA